MNEAYLNILDIFPFEQLEKSISKLKIHCMIQAYATMSVSLLGIDSTQQRVKQLKPLENIVINEFKNQEIYKMRMRDNLLDLYCNIEEFII